MARARFTWFILVFLVLLGCRKDSVTPASVSLKDFVVTIDRTSGYEIQVDWVAVPLATKYELYRAAYSTEDETTLNAPELLGSFEPSVLGYQDVDLPASDSMFYFVEVSTEDSTWKSPVMSVYGNPIFDFAPLQFKLIPETSLGVIRTDFGLVLMDVLQKEEKQRLTLTDSIGPIEVAGNNGNYEIYVPSADGNVYIYDIGLSLLATIQTGYPVSSVTSNGKGLVFTSGSAPVRPLKVFDRTTLNQVGSKVDKPNTRLFYSNGLLSIVNSNLNDQTQITWFNFTDTTGNDPISNSYGYVSVDTRLAKASKKYLATTDHGFLYTSTYPIGNVNIALANVPRFNDFEFSEDSEVVYASSSSDRTVESRLLINMPTPPASTSITLKWYPFLIGVQAKTLYSIGNLEQLASGTHPTRFIFEKVTLP